MAVLFVGLVTTSAQGVLMTIEVEAMIDGRDVLILRDDTLQWVHYDWAAVGRHEGLDEPTIITTSLDGLIQMDEVQWYPQWPEAAPAQIRYGAESSIYYGLTPELPPADLITSIDLDPLASRGTVTLEQVATGTGSHELHIEFDDNIYGGHDWYKVQVAIEYIPEPATIALFGVGMLLLFVRRRM